MYLVFYVSRVRTPRALSFESNFTVEYLFKTREVRDAKFFALISIIFQEKMTSMWVLRVPRHSAISHVVTIASVYGHVLSLFTLALLSILFCFFVTEELLDEMEHQIKQAEESVAVSRHELSNVQHEIRQLLSQSQGNL